MPLDNNQTYSSETLKTREAEQIKLLTEQVPAAVLGNIACTLIVAIGFWSIAPRNLLIGWLTISWLITGLRLLLRQKYCADLNNLKTNKHLINTLAKLSSLSGLTWGLGSYFLIPPGNPYALILMVIVCAGICSGSVITLGHYKRTASTFILFCVPFIALRLLAEASFYSDLAAFGSIVYMWMLLKGSRTSEAYFNDKIDSDIQSQKSRQRLINHLENTPLAAVEWDNELKIINWNRAAETMFGHKSAEVIGKNASILIPEEELESIKKMAMGLITDKQANHAVIKNIRADGSLITCEWHNTYLEENGTFSGISSFIHDISERIEKENIIRHQAHYDALTDLPNRIFFKERLLQALASAKRGDGYAAALLIDLDHFKDINDSQGHDTGDKVLQLFAHQLQTNLRHCDTISRQGGDEFVVLIDNLTNDLKIAQLRVAEVANIIKQITENPIHIDNHDYHIGCSIGIAIIEGHETTEEVMKHADLALYSVKDTERGDYAFFKDEFASQAERHLQLHNSLHSALNENEFKLYYQAKADLKTNRIVGCEALIRWFSKQHGFVSPNEFIHLIENSSLIEDVGDWVLNEACRQIRAWLDAGLWEDDMIMAINIGARQLLAPNFPQQVQQALANHKIAGQMLELEITERLFIQDADLAKKHMEAVAALGPSFAIDDFGTGYSCLSYLKLLPLRTLKVDKSFIDPLLEDNKDDALVKTVLHICRQLNLKAVAEGIETEGQRQHLQALDCDYYQGYLHSKPMSNLDYEQQLRKNIH